MTSRRAPRREDAMTSVIADLYAASTDDRLWQTAAAGIRDLAGGICVTHVLIDRQTGGMPHQTLLYDDATCLERYFAEGINRLDPQVRFAASVDRSRVWVDVDHLDHEHPETREFCRWIDSNSALGHHLSGGALIADGEMLSAISVHRARGQGVVPDEDRRMMAALLPHLQRASELAFIHAEKVRESYWNGMLAQRSEPSALIGRDGRILRTTSSLDTLLLRDDGLDIRGGRLRADHPDDDSRLRTALCRVAGACPYAGAARIRRRSGRAPLALTVYPVSLPAEPFARDDVIGLVTVVDPTTVSRRPSVFREVFSLTARESQLTDLLMAGHSIESAAAALDISPNTARIHLTRLFAKTGTSRQAELMRLLARL